MFFIYDTSRSLAVTQGSRDSARYETESLSHDRSSLKDETELKKAERFIIVT